MIKGKKIPEGQNILPVESDAKTLRPGDNLDEDPDPLNRPLGGWLRTQSGNPKPGDTGVGAGRWGRQVLGEA